MFRRAGQAVNGEVITVEGTLQVIRHRAKTGEDGTRFPAFLEYQLVGCRRDY